MLTGLRLGNFKAFGETQHIPIKPLTLIFGANSAGKSSIIHGLLLACHANETGILDVHQTRIGGESVNLGGFHQYVHRHDVQRKVEWEALFGAPLMRELEHEDHYYPLDQFTVSMLLGLSQDNATATQTACNIESFSISAEGKNFILASRTTNKNYSLKHVNSGYKFFERMLQYNAGNYPMDVMDKDILQIVREVVKEEDWLTATLLMPDSITSNNPSVIPEIAKTLSSLSWIGESNTLSKIIFQQTRQAFEETLKQCIAGVTQSLSNELSRVRYLGPLRSYPPRHLAFQDDKDPHWFAGGGYAWEEVRSNPEVRNAVNGWLGNLLQSPYELLVRRFIAEDNSLASIEELVLRDIRFKTIVSHRDIGIGISQVLPVLVSAFGSKQAIVAIEQPELHLHPALQAELGDVFICAALSKSHIKNTFLLETHSEHLLLRIMRRMRDTVRGTLPEGIPEVHPNDVAILYVDRKADDSTSVVMRLRLDEEGQLIDPWPHGFFEERFTERFD